MSGPASPGQQVCTGSCDKSRRNIGPGLRRGDEFRARLQGRARRRDTSRLASAMDRGGCGARIQAMNAPSRSRSAGTRAKPRRHALPRPEQIGDHGQVRGPARRDGPLEAQHRPARRDHPPVHLGNFKVHIDGRGDAPHIALAAEIGKKRAQVRKRGQAAAVHDERTGGVRSKEKPPAWLYKICQHTFNLASAFVHGLRRFLF